MTIGLYTASIVSPVMSIDNPNYLNGKNDLNDRDGVWP
jgi:hypothetical protein